MLTYLSFLLLFIGLPLVITIGFYISKFLQANVTEKKLILNILLALFILAPIALIYTTPWDNFLVENSIWFYESTKVLGIIIGFVPIEEYSFFVFQTLLIGLLFGWLFLRRENETETNSVFFSKIRVLPMIALISIWVMALITFINGIEPLTYLNLILLWGIPPILIQLVYGADILWLRRHDVFSGISLSTLYLGAADAIAIFDGIWTISKGTSTGLLILQILPIEEFLFFLTTNILIIFGLTLIIDSRSRKRFDKLYSKGKGIFFRI